MRTVILLLVLACPLLSRAQAFEARYFHRNNDTLPYRILLPEQFEPQKKYPLIVFMHGAGERGKDNKRQLTHGGRLFTNDTVRKNFPAIVVFPQCPANATWAVMNFSRNDSGKVTGMKILSDAPPTPPSALLYQLIDSLAASGSVDTRRLYVGGLSLGGMGTFDILARFPKRFAAAFPICGAGDESLASRYAKNTAVWIFHGSDDAVVPPASSRIFYRNLQQAGAEVKYSEYPGVGHNSWDNAFAEPELLPWLFSHSLK